MAMLNYQRINIVDLNNSDNNGNVSKLLIAGIRDCGKKNIHQFWGLTTWIHPHLMKPLDLRLITQPLAVRQSFQMSLALEIHDIPPFFKKELPKKCHKCQRSQF